MDIIDFANILCTTGALEYLKESSVGSVDICTDPAYESVRSAAIRHIIEALHNGTLKYRRYNDRHFSENGSSISQPAKRHREARQ